MLPGEKCGHTGSSNINLSQAAATSARPWASPSLWFYCNLMDHRESTFWSQHTASWMGDEGKPSFWEVIQTVGHECRARMASTASGNKVRLGKLRHRSSDRHSPL